MSAAVTRRSLGPEQRGQLVADRTLQVAEDLRPVRIVLKARGRLVQVSGEPFVGVLVEPVRSGLSAQADDDRLVHGLPPQFVDE